MELVPHGQSVLRDVELPQQLVKLLCREATHVTVARNVERLCDRHSVYISEREILKGGKDGFLRFCFFLFFLNQKTSKGRIFWFLWFFLRYYCCCLYKLAYMLKPYSYFFIITWFSIYMNLYFTVFTLHSFCQYSRVLGYFWLSTLKPKKNKIP